MRLPQVSEQTAMVTGPAGLGSCVNATPAFFQTLKFLFDVGDFKGGQWNSLREHCLVLAAGLAFGSRDSSAPSTASGETTVIQRRPPPTGISCFVTKPKISV